MRLTDKQIALIRESYASLAPTLGEASLNFYDNLFERAPHLRALFRDDLTGQGMRFMSAVRVIADNLEDADRLDEQVAKLAEGHAQFGIAEESYRAMEDALIRTFSGRLGDKFTARDRGGVARCVPPSM